MAVATHAGARPVALRAASGPTVGLGHAMRSLAVALELAELGVPAELVVDDRATAEALQARTAGAPSLRVSSAGPEWSPIAAGALWLDGFRPWTAEVDAASAAGVPLLLVENRGEAREHATAVLYPALHHEDDAWDRAHPERVLAGPTWVPLRRAVLEASAPTRDVDLLVTFGGSDPQDLTSRVLAALAGRETRIVVAVGALMADRRDALAAYLAALPNARLLTPGAELAPWLPRCRAAVTALGTTLYELAYHAVPALVLANYADDAAALAWYGEHGPHVPLGVARDVSDDALTRALGCMAEPPTVARPSGLGEGAARLARWLAGRERSVA